MRKIKLTIAYDGTDYFGWAKQKNRPTIQGVLENTIAELTGKYVELFGSSRTDAGVHALGQVAHFEIDCPVPTENLARAVNNKLPQSISIISAEQVKPDFDAIKNTKSKMYRYWIYTGVNRPVLQAHYCWYYPYKLDSAVMAQAAQYLIGEHDFKSFASAADKRSSSIRTILRCDVQSAPEISYAYHRAANVNERSSLPWICIDVEADGFLYNMVRNIVGTLVEVGRGRYKPEKVEKILKACNRSSAGPIAPPHGLCLMWIRY